MLLPVTRCCGRSRSQTISWIWESVAEFATQLTFRKERPDKSHKKCILPDSILPEIQEAVELLQFQDDCRFTGNPNFISSDIHVLKMFHRRLKASDFLLIIIAITLLLCFCAHPSLNSEFVNFAMWSELTERNKSSRIHLT